MYRSTNVQLSVQECPDGIRDEDCERNRYIRESDLYHVVGDIIVCIKPYFENRSAYDWGNANMAKICAECQLCNGNGTKIGQTMLRFYVNGRYVLDKKCSVELDKCPAYRYVMENSSVHSVSPGKVKVTVFGREKFTSDIRKKCFLCDKQR